MKRAFLLLALFLIGEPGCSTQVTPNGVNGRCESDDQCDRNAGLICRCLRRRNPDDEGPDEILSPGYCQTAAFKCSDAGVASDAEGVDSGSAVDSAIDSPSEGGSETTDASDDG